MSSFRSRLIKYWFRHGRPLASNKGSVQEQREQMERANLVLRTHHGVLVTSVDAGGVPAEWSIPSGAAAERCLMYIHGGAWSMGSPRSHRGMVSHIAFESSVRALSIDYRLAPEHPFPAGLDDCISAYTWLLENGYSSGHIVVAGDSAGGNLALAMLVVLRDRGIPLPAAAVALSPATDLTGSSESLRMRLPLDPVLHDIGSSSVVPDYITSHDPREPYISPVFADLHGLPPILIHVGDNEILLDDAVHFGELARQAGVECTVVVWPEMFHVFQAFVPYLPEARQSVKQIAEFIKARVGNG